MRTRVAPLVAALLVSLCPVALYAVDIPSDPPEYLQLTIRPQWRLVDLNEAMAQLGEEIEKPVALSGHVKDANPTLILLEDQKSTVLEVLELLERTHDLHFTAEPLRLVVLTGTEHRRRQRALVNLNLRDYGLFFRPRSGSSYPTLNSDDESDGASPFGFAEEDEDEFPFELLNFLETIQSITGGGDVEVRGTGNLMLMVTPKEEARLRALCDQLYSMIVRRSSWTVHFGTLPADSQATGGIVEREAIRNLVESLKDRVELSATAMNGQSVTAWRGIYRPDVQDAEVNQTGAYPVVNPVVLGSTGGRRVRLQPHVGLSRTLLSFNAEWTEVSPEVSKAEIDSPASLVGSRSSTNGTTSKDGKTQEWTLHQPEQADPGRKLTLTQRTIWEWKPKGEVFVPSDHGLVILGLHGDERIAIVFEEVK
ncbi:MAG: hypothetical protein AAF488_02260 [Planctomycetota bacterium]